MCEVTPNAEQIDHAERDLEGMYSGYPDKNRLQRYLSHPDKKTRLFRIIDELGFDPTNVLEKFRFEVYGKFLGFDCPDLTALPVPALQEGFNWILPIVAIHDKTPNEAIFQEMKRQFGEKHDSEGGWKWTDDILDDIVTVNDRDPLKSGPYVIRTRDRKEADEELKETSAVQLAERKIQCVTLYERQVMEAFYYVETGEHLDVENVTLCAGSRLSHGFVPDADWRPFNRRFGVNWRGAKHSYDFLRARQVVSI